VEEVITVFVFNWN